jgi:hypothetical protein
LRVEPAIGRIPERPIIEIESVYVDVGDQIVLPEMQKPPLAERLRARPPKRPGGYQSSI